MPALLSELDDPLYAGKLEILENLAVEPPAALLLEGGTERLRLAAGKYWAMLQNCPQAQTRMRQGEKPVPCCNCATCRQIANEDWIDLLIFDGRISNRLDEEKPGLIRAMRMENMRELRSRLASAPRGEGKRVILLQGIGATREEAQNSLLKVLEEPAPHNLFVLLVGQRQQILPTLVSRSFCLALPWRSSVDGQPPEELADLLAQMENFLLSGRGFLDKIAQKGKLDANQAALLVLELQKALVRAMTKSDSAKKTGLDTVFARLDARGIATASRWLSESLDMLGPGVAPARIMEALASRLFLLCRQSA